MADKEVSPKLLESQTEVEKNQEAGKLPEASNTANMAKADQPVDFKANLPSSNDDRDPSQRLDVPAEIHSEFENSTDDDLQHRNTNRAGSHFSQDTQPDLDFDPNAIPEVSVRLGVAAPPHLHANIQISNHQSTWINVDPPKSQRPRQPVNRSSPEPPPPKRMKLSVPKNDKKKAISKNLETPTEGVTKGKSGGKKKPVEKPEDDEDEEDTYELEFIVAHRYKKKARKLITEYKVRWLGYDEDADTWEPESNILGESAKESVRLYWEEQKKMGVLKRLASGKQQKRGQQSKERSTSKASEATEELVRGESEVQEVIEKETMEAEAVLSSSTADVNKSGMTDWSFEPINKHDWFGIREEDAKSKTAKREFKNLFVADRIPSLSELLLAGTTGTGRVTRSSLKPLKGEESTPRASKTPEPSRRRRRLTLSPGAATSSSTVVTTIMAERPTSKRARTSVLGGKSIYAELSSSESPENDTVTPTAVLARSSPFPSPGISSSSIMPRKRASEMGAPPSTSISKVSRKSGPVEPTVTPSSHQGTSRSRETTVNSSQASMSEAEDMQFDVSQPSRSSETPPLKRKPGIMDSDKKNRPRIVDDYESSVSPEPNHSHDEDDGSSTDEVIELDDEEDQNDDEPLPLEVTDPESSDSAWSEVGPDGELLVLTNKHFTGLKDVDLDKLIPPPAEPVLSDVMVEFRCSNIPFDPKGAAQTLDEFFELAENLEVRKVFATIKVGTMDNANLNVKDEQGWTLLHRLAQTPCNSEHGLCCVLSLIVNQCGCDPTVRDDHRRTPLHLAVISGNECALKRLIILGSPINTVDIYGRTPLISGLARGNLNHVREVLLSGANFYQVDDYMIKKGGELSNELRNLVNNHRNELCEAMDHARTYVLPQATCGLKKTLMATLFVAPIFENTTIEYEFFLNKVPRTANASNNYLLFEIGILHIDPFSGQMKVRMWQQSPVRSVLVNDEEPVFMHKTTNYISLPKLVVGKNVVKVELMNQTYKGTRFCIITRLAHVLMLGFHRPNRMDPTVGNLMPLTMGNPPIGQAKIVAPPALQQLAGRLRPRYYHDTSATLLRPPLSIHQSVRPVMRPLLDTRPMINSVNAVSRIRTYGINHHSSLVTKNTPSSYTVRQVQPTRMISSGMLMARPPYASRGPPIRHVQPSLVSSARPSPPPPSRLRPSSSGREIEQIKLKNLPSNVIRRRHSPPPPSLRQFPHNVIRRTSPSPAQPMMPGGNFVTTSRSTEETRISSDMYHPHSPPPGPSNASSSSTPMDETLPSSRYTSTSSGTRMVPSGFVPYRGGEPNRSRLLAPRFPMQGQSNVRIVPLRPSNITSDDARPMIRHQTQRFLNSNSGLFQRIGPLSSGLTPLSSSNSTTSYHPLNFQPPGRSRQSLVSQQPPPSLTSPPPNPADT